MKTFLIPLALVTAFGSADSTEVQDSGGAAPPARDLVTEWHATYVDETAPTHVRNNAARNLHRSDPVELLDTLTAAAPVWFTEFALHTKATPRADIERMVADRFVATNAASLLASTDHDELKGGFDCGSFSDYIDALAGIHPVTPQESALVYTLYGLSDCGAQIEPAVIRFTIERGAPADAARVASEGLGEGGQRVIREEMAKSDPKPNAVIMAFYEPSIRAPIDVEALWAAPKGSIPDSLRQFAYAVKVAATCSSADDYAEEADRLATTVGAAHAPAMLLLLPDPEIRTELATRYFEKSKDGESRLADGLSDRLQHSIMAAYSKTGRRSPGTKGVTCP